MKSIRILTLTGPGGCGKTRLCLQAAAELMEAYRDKVCVVELAALTDPAQVPQALARVLQYQHQGARQPLTEALAAHLQFRQILLVLDNCEHLVESCATLVDLLLRTCPGVQVMATSREPLRMPGETVWQVPPLGVPSLEEAMQPKLLLQHDAVRLFVDRARAAFPPFELTGENGMAVAEICVQLDGMPLALELAAAWVRTLAVHEIAGRLGDRFRLLTGGYRTTVPQQRTLRAAMDWSHDLLSEPEKALWRRLAVFTGGFTLDACESVCGGGAIEAVDVLLLLAQLVDKSLVVAEGQNQRRYRLLETVRHYGWEKLHASVEGPESQARHMSFYLKLVEQAANELGGPKAPQWLERLEQEHDNIRAALRWALESGAIPALIRMSTMLTRFWHMHGHLEEGRVWLRAALERLPERTEQRANALLAAGLLASVQSDYEAALPLYQESLALLREQDNLNGVASVLTNLGLLLYYQGNLREALARYEESLTIRRAQGNKPGAASVLNNLAMVAMALGEYERARQYIEESLSIKQQGGDKAGIANALNNLGNIARVQGKFNEATAFGRQALSLWHELGSGWGAAITLLTLGLTAMAQGDVAEGERMMRESLEQRKKITDRQGIVECLEALAQAAVKRGDSARALRLFGSAEAQREALRAPMSPEELPTYHQVVETVRTMLDDRTFASEWEAGKRLSSDAAIELALQKTRGGRDLPPVVSSGRRAPDPVCDLTPRETEIVRLVAWGLSDREIAGRLVISPRTVDNHLRNIFGKVEVSSRAALVAWAFRNSVVEVE